mgnify:CR=1 FL=1
MKGTWEVVTEIMKANGFKAKRKVTPTGMELVIRQMLNQCYTIGYSNGGRRR